MAGRKRAIRWGWAVAAACAIGGGGLGFYQYQQGIFRSSELPKGVQVGMVERGDLDQKITAAGVVAAQTGAKVNIGSQISGRIRTLPADIGELVRAGEIVAVLDAPDLEAQVEQQRHSVAAASTSLEQAESRLEQAKLNHALSREQTTAQVDEAGFAVRAAAERLQVAEAAAKLQPSETANEIARAEAAFSTARSQERQVRKTVHLQVVQGQAAIDEARVAVENSERLLNRQEALLKRGFIAGQEVDDTRAAARQAAARLQNAEASLLIVKEKTEADLQAARDQTLQAEAALDAARARRLQDEARAAEERTARETVRQSLATLALRRSGRRQDVLRERAVEEAAAGVRQARAALRQAEALLRFQKAQLEKAVVRSPITGTVLSITAQQGETVAAGFAAPTLITVADLTRLEIRAYVDEVDIGRVRLGQPAEVRVETFPDRVSHGRVTKIASASTVKDNVVTYETTILLGGAEGLVRPDMTADVSLILGRRPNVLLVPSEAVHRELRRTVVYVLHREKRGKERVELREVRVGADDGIYTEIPSGVREGEEVILAGLPRLGVKPSDAQNSDRGQNR